MIVPLFFITLVFMGGCISMEATATEPTAPAYTELPLAPTSEVSKTPVLLAATLTPTPVPEQPTATSTNEPVILQLTYRKNTAIYALDVLCQELLARCFSEPYLLFEADGKVFSMDWSPDGNHVVFCSEGNLFVTDWNGGHMVEIPNEPGSAIWPSWSPDGKRIAYIFGSDIDYPQIRVYELISGNTKQIYENAIMPTRVYWLSDGRIVYISRKSTDDYSHMINISGDQIITSISLPESEEGQVMVYDLSFSPDHSMLVLSGDIEYNSSLYLYEINASGFIRLTPEGNSDFFPSWAPNKEWVAYMSNIEGDYDIYILKTDGSEKIKITNSTEDEGFSAWRLLSQP